MKKRILITGGLGNLGLWITNHFISLNYEVFVLSRSSDISHILISKNFTVIEADITNLDSIKLPNNLDFVIHLASYNEFFNAGYYKEALEVNSLGTRNLIEVLKKENIKKIIYFSTFHIYGKSEGVINEATIPTPKNDYALTHFFAEKYIEASNLPYIIFRLTNSYGTPKNYNSSKWYLVLNDLVKMAYEKKKIILKSNGKALRDYIFMGDVAKIVEKSLNFSSNQIINLSSNQTKSVLEIAKMVQHQFFKIYNSNIPIEINKKDKSTPHFLQVENKKLLNIIDFSFKDEFENEIQNIFKLLETK